MEAQKMFGARIPPVWALTALALAVRLFAFLGRGDYVAFDEGWYLLLGRNLWGGEGYTLAGLRHTTLSPLFPILAGGAGRLLGDPIWAGRLVAALAAALLVVPCWFIFRRLAGQTTAVLGCLFVALLPALAPFGAPYWVGWDLWVGAEPVYHVLLFGALALVLRGLERQRAREWAGAGVLFALAYLARPEAVLPFGLIGVGVLATAAVKRSARLLSVAAVCGVAFALVAAPYWIYLHDTLGRWALSGRGVEVAAAVAEVAGTEPAGATRSNHVIENMLWRGQHGDYARALFALDGSGTRLASAYWGVPPRTQIVPADPAPADAVASAPAALPAEADPSGEPSDPAPAPAAAGAEPSGTLTLWGRALGEVIPVVLWPLLAIGLLAPGRRRRDLLLLAPLLVTSLAIAEVVAVDPRTQLFLVPLAAFYAARGVRVAAATVDRRTSRRHVRRGFVRSGLAAAAAILLFGGVAAPTLSAVRHGSGHQVLGTEYRLVGEALREIAPEGARVISWHPQVALRAGREWRPLPIEPLDRIARYAAASGDAIVVFGVHNPHPLPEQAMRREYLLLRVEPAAAHSQAWHIELSEARELYASGTLQAR